MTEAELAQRIARGRERKARRFARAIWNEWTEAERAGEGLKIWAASRDWWRAFANSIGAREPSEDTVRLVLSKLRTACELHRAGRL